VPFADTTQIKVPKNGLTDEQVLFLGDIFPTGWQAVVQCDIQPPTPVAIWGAGAVGQMAIRSAILLGAKQVICIDRVPERLDMAKPAEPSRSISTPESVIERLEALTTARGPEKCIDCGRHGGARDLDPRRDVRPRKQAVMLETDRDRTFCVRWRISAARPARCRSPGVYGGIIDKFPIGMIMNKGLTIRTGQTHVNRWTDDLLRLIEEGKIDPSFVITHTVPLEEGPEMYKRFRDKEDGCIKVVMKPGASAH
jgi:threonine dehydrogenase-like Zn-dependent dehydrogenase